MSKMKKISASAMAFMLVLCVGYFSMMSPTSAWFYNSGVIDSGESFIFGDLSVDTKFFSKNELVFDGATRFSDPDEVLFDEVVNVEEILVANNGTIPARIYANVVNKGSSSGLRWFVYTDEMLVDGSIKKTLESVLPKLTDEALNNYNVGKDGKSGKYIELFPNEVTSVKIATWIDYDTVSGKLAEARTLNGYDVEISLIATQNTDGVIQR